MTTQRMLGIVLGLAVVWPCSRVAGDARQGDRPPAASGAAASSRPAPTKWRVEVRELGRHQKRDFGEFLVIGASGLHLAYRANAEGGKKAMFHDGKLGPAYDRLGKPILSPNGKRLAYSGRTGKESWLVLDGKPGPAFDRVLDKTIAFSGDSRRLAYLAVRGKQTFAVVDGSLHPLRGGNASPVFSPDARRVALTESWWDKGKKSMQYRVVVDDKPAAAFELIGAPVFSPDSKRFRYSADRWEEGKKKWVAVVVDGVAGTVWDEVGIQRFTEDSKHVAYWAKKGAKWHVVMDGKISEGFDEICYQTWAVRVGCAVRKGKNWHAWADGKLSEPYAYVSAVWFSPDARRTAFVAARDRGGSFLVVDGKPGPISGKIKTERSPFSPDSRRLAYRVGKGFRWHAVIDATVSEGFAGLTEITFSPDGKRTAYAMSKGDGKVFAVVDGQLSTAWDTVLSEQILFSPDSAHVAYIAKDGRSQYAVVDGRKSEACDAIARVSYRCVFSPTGGHFACVGRKAKSAFVLLDGRRGPGFNGIVEGGPTFHADSTLEYLAWRKGVLCRVRHVPGTGRN